MPLPFLVPIVVVVLAEIAVYVVVGEAIGVLPTLGLTLASMAAGMVLLRLQGLAALRRIRAGAKAGQAPVEALVDAAALPIAALLMIVPGFITSAIGLLLFVPPIRARLLKRLRRVAATMLAGARRRQKPGPAVIELGPDDYARAPRGERPGEQDG